MQPMNPVRQMQCEEADGTKTVLTSSWVQPVRKVTGQTQTNTGVGLGAVLYLFLGKLVGLHQVKKGTGQTQVLGLSLPLPQQTCWGPANELAD